MYGKVFASMYDGTLRDCWEAIAVFPHLIVLATKDGVVDYTPKALHYRTGIPLEIIERALEFLAQPDEHSRTGSSQGKRIELLDSHRNWGWRIVNYTKYRDTRTMDQLVTIHRGDLDDALGSLGQPITSADSIPLRSAKAPYADADADADADAEEGRPPPDGGELVLTPPSPAPKRVPPCPYAKLVAAYNEHCPSLPQCRVLNDKRKRQLQQCWKLYPDLDWWAGKFFPHIERSRFLRGEVNGKEHSNWRADFDFVIRPDKFASIVEGKYDD